MTRNLVTAAISAHFELDERHVLKMKKLHWTDSEFDRTHFWLLLLLLLLLLKKLQRMERLMFRAVVQLKTIVQQNRIETK